MKVLTTYQCEGCYEIYDSLEEAMECEAQGREEPIVQVGDFVTTHAGDYGRFGWFDGDPEWVTEKTRGLHGPAKVYSLIYVVTAITYGDKWHPHLCKYHLATKGMTEKSGYGQGYTFPATHTGITKIESSLDASDLIGIETNDLI